jgi:hypothetical protein
MRNQITFVIPASRIMALVIKQIAIKLLTTICTSETAVENYISTSETGRRQ